MKKSVLILLSFLLSCSVLFSCNEKEDEESGDDNSSEVLSVAEEDPWPWETLENPNITVLSHITQETRDLALEDGWDLGNFKAGELFEERFGGKITYVYAEWIEQGTKLATLVAADQAPDVVPVNGGNFPGVATGQTIQPIEDLPNLDMSLWNEDIMKYSQYNGKSYMLAAKSKIPGANTLRYNKTILEQNLQPLPIDLFEQGEWTWDNFTDIARECTKDLDGDGVIDVWGSVVGDYPGTWTMANDTSMIKFTDSGVKSNFDDPKILNVLTYVQSWMASPEQGGITEFGLHNKDTFFAKSKAAFDWSWKSVPADFKDETGLICYPFGPDNKEQKIVVGIEGHGIPVGADNYEAAYAYIWGCQEEPELKEFYKEDYFRNYQDGDEAAQKFYDVFVDPEGPAKDHPFIGAFEACYTDHYAVCWKVGNDLSANKMPPATVASTYHAEVQGYVDKAFNNPV